MLDRLSAVERDLYESDFRLADAGFDDGRVEATSQRRAAFWRHWTAYCRPLGVDPELQDVRYQERIRLLSGFAARVRTGYYGHGRKVKTATVSSALTAIGQTIALVHGENPIKLRYSSDLAPRLSQMLQG